MYDKMWRQGLLIKDGRHRATAQMDKVRTGNKYSKTCIVGNVTPQWSRASHLLFYHFH